MFYISPWKAAVIVAVCVLGAILALPNLFSAETMAKVPGWLPHRQIALGLDLQGGSHLLMQVDGAAVARERLEGLSDVIRDELRKSAIPARSVSASNQAITVKLEGDAEARAALELLRKLDTEATVEQTGPAEIELRLSEAAIEQRVSAAVDQALEIIRRRIDETGVREPTIQRQGPERILVQLPGVDDPARIKALIGKTAKMTFHLVDDSIDPSTMQSGRAVAGAMILPLADRRGQPTPTIAVRRRVLVSGENLVDAQPTFHQAEWQVSFRFDTLGGKRFGEATQQNVGKRLAIVLDNQVISAPQIREPILGGQGVITGSFTADEAQDLALLLRAGALPAPLTPLEERTVGPGLGADSIAAGETASLISVALVAGFMILVYGTFGLFANIALAINLVLIFGVMSLLQATLTLPGIAGLVLTVGVAVDANVLIFERVREEIRNGRTPIAAIDAGFDRAMSAIIDANLTTLISTALLYIVGTGSVRGFAVTLAIGTVTSMFTAIIVTRLIVLTWMRRAKPRALPI